VGFAIGLPTTAHKPYSMSNVGQRSARCSEDSHLVGLAFYGCEENAQQFEGLWVLWLFSMAAGFGLAE